MKITIQETINNVAVSSQGTVVTVSGVGIQGASGSGGGSSNLPSGGNEDMLLAKNSNSDYDFKWTANPDNLWLSSSFSGGTF